MIRNLVAVICLIAPLFACSTLEFPGVYRLQIEQGNIITEEMVAQLQPGMSESQVEFILGTPLIRDSFSPDRWDYVHNVRKADNTVEKQRLTVFFKNGVLDHYESTVAPTAKDSGETAAKAAENQDPPAQGDDKDESELEANNSTE